MKLTRTLPLALALLFPASCKPDHQPVALKHFQSFGDADSNCSLWTEMVDRQDGDGENNTQYFSQWLSGFMTAVNAYATNDGSLGGGPTALLIYLG